MKTLKYIFIGSIVIANMTDSFAQNKVFVSEFFKSYKCEANRDYAGAIKSIEDNYDGLSYEENLRLGWLCYKSEKYDESLKFYQIATNLMPAAIEPKVGYLYPTAALNKVDNLMAQYNKILELDPLDINSNYQLGYYYYNKNKMDLAKKYFQKVLDLYPSGYEPYLRYTLNQMQIIKTQSEKVLTAFTKSYELETKMDYAGAIALLTAVYDKQYYDINLRLGWLNYLAKQYTESVKYYQIAIDLKPTSIEPRLGIVNPAFLLGNSELINSNYKKVLEINPLNTSANYQMGLISYNKKDYESAYKYFEKIVKLYPFDHDSLLMLAWTNYQIKKNAEAKALFNKVLMNSPSDKSAQEGLSLASK
jgi:tetratricopeptide (TPR) repeat protein